MQRSRLQAASRCVAAGPLSLPRALPFHLPRATRAMQALAGGQAFRQPQDRGIGAPVAGGVFSASGRPCAQRQEIEKSGARPTARYSAASQRSLPSVAAEAAICSFHPSAAALGKAGLRLGGADTNETLKLRWRAAGVPPSAQARRNTPCGADGHWPPGEGAGGMAAARTWQTPRNRYRVSGLRKLLGFVLGFGLEHPGALAPPGKAAWRPELGSSATQPLVPATEPIRCGSPARVGKQLPVGAEYFWEFTRGTYD